MARVKGGVSSRRRHKKVVDAASGYRGRRKSSFRIARQAVDKAREYAYRDRRVRRRHMRALWIQRVNAAARLSGFTYASLMGALRKAGVVLDRKALSEMAIHDPEGFRNLLSSVGANDGKP